MHASGPLRPRHRSRESPRYAVCGLGLMGGSLCYALKHFIPECEVLGIEVRPDRLHEARQLEVADTYRESLEGFDASEVDAVFLAVPVSVIGPLVRELAAGSSGECLLVDLGSAKQVVYEDVGELPAGAHFVGGHPMTGSALEGLEGADPHLYENAVFILTPRRGDDAHAVEVVRSVLDCLGALVWVMEPAHHDDCVSTISHLPYLLAVTMVEVLREQHGDDGGDAARIAAGGFHGATRVATCTPEVFKDILLANRKALLRDLTVLRERIDTVAAALEEQDATQLTERFRAAQEFRRLLPTRRKGILPKLPEAIVKAKDQPGFIGNVTTLIGAAQVNIRDLEVLHSREGEHGTLRIAFEDEAGRRKALGILNAAGFVAAERD